MPVRRSHEVATITPVITDRLLRARWLGLALVAVAAGIVGGGRGDWDQFVRVGRALVSTDGVHVYVRHGDTQTGPLALLLARGLAWTPRDGFVACVVLCAALGLLVLWLAERGGRRAAGPDAAADPAVRRRLQAVTAAGGLVLVPAWAKLGAYGHLDDALVITLAVAATVLVLEREHHPRAMELAGLALGLAIAIKPWAVIFLPLLAADIFPTPAHPRSDDNSVRFRPFCRQFAGGWWTRGRPLAIALGVAAVAWLPFLVGDPATRHALKPTVLVAPDSVLHLFGVTDASLPDWLRIAQLAGGLAIGVLIVLRGGVGGLVLAVVAVRLATDPAAWPYYTPGLVAGALLWDQVDTRRLLPYATAAAWLALAPSWLVPSDGARGALRLAACVGAVALVLVSGRSPSAAPPCPTSDRPAAG